MFSPHEYFFSPDTVTDIPNNVYNIPRGNPHIFIFFIYIRICLHPPICFIKTDALGHNFIRGITSLDCPSLISIADTHHLHRPIERVLEYLRSEHFTYLSCENDRHHLKWYHRCGFQNTLWLPNIALNPTILDPLDISETNHNICFVGSWEVPPI